MTTLSTKITNRVGVPHDPFQNPAEIERAKAVSMAAQVEPEAPKPPTWADRLASIFGKRQETARQTYLRLFRKAELDGKVLSDAELTTMADSAERAGITMDEIESHKGLVRRWRENVEAAKILPSAQSARAECQRQIDELEQQILKASAEVQKVREKWGQAHWDVQVSGTAAAKALELEGQVRELLGDA